MKYALIATLFATVVAAGTLAGCQTTASVPAPVPAATTTLLKLDGTNLAKACTRVSTAVGYFNDLSWLIPEPYKTAGSLAVSAVSDICSAGSQASLLASSQSIVAVIMKLDGIWQQVQANTKAK